MYIPVYPLYTLCILLYILVNQLTDAEDRHIATKYANVQIERITVSATLVVKGGCLVTIINRTLNLRRNNTNQLKLHKITSN